MTDLPTNKYRHNNRTPFKLIADGAEIGCYMTRGSARELAESLLRTGKIKHYRVMNLNDMVVDSNE